MTDYDKELDEILPKELPCDVHEDIDGCPVIEAKAKLSALLRRVEVEGRKDELSWVLGSREIMPPDFEQVRDRMKELEAEL